MVTSNSIINPGAPIKSSIPLVARKFGQGFGFSSPSEGSSRAEKEVLIDLSGNATQRTGLRETQNLSGRKASSSPLSQALGALSDIASRIQQLQDKYSQSPGGSASSESISKELNSLAQEFARITDSKIFKPSDGSSKDLYNGSLEFSDSTFKSVLDSGDSNRISTFNESLDGLRSISFENILSDKSIAGKIQGFIQAINGAINPANEKEKEQSVSSANSNLIIVPLPQASIKTIGQAEGLSVSLLSYSNDDLIRAAAAHVNIESTNVLLLTYDPPEPESEQEKEEREEKEQNGKTVELENPTQLPTAAAQQENAD